MKILVKLLALFVLFALSMAISMGYGQSGMPEQVIKFGYKDRFDSRMGSDNGMATDVGPNKTWDLKHIHPNSSISGDFYNTPPNEANPVTQLVRTEGSLYAEWTKDLGWVQEFTYIGFPANTWYHSDVWNRLGIVNSGTTVTEDTYRISRSLSDDSFLEDILTIRGNFVAQANRNADPNIFNNLFCTAEHRV